MEPAAGARAKETGMRGRVSPKSVFCTGCGRRTDHISVKAVGAGSAVTIMLCVECRKVYHGQRNHDVIMEGSGCRRR